MIGVIFVCTYYWNVLKYYYSKGVTWIKQNRIETTLQEKPLSFIALQPQILDSFKNGKSDFLPIFFFVQSVFFLFVCLSFSLKLPNLLHIQNLCTLFQVISHL